MADPFANNNDYFPATTTEGTKVWIKKSDVSGIEIIPSTSRSEGYLKLYIAGYHFSLRMTIEELEKTLEN